MFIGLWCIADREGRLEDRPDRIKIQLFPSDDLDVKSLLDELTSKVDANGSPAFLIRYQVDGIRYIQIVHFLSHQSPHKHERLSTIPGPSRIRVQDTSRVVVSDEHDTPTVEASDEHKSCHPDSLLLIPDSFAFSLEVQEKASELLQFTPLQAIKKAAWEVSSLETKDRRHVFSKQYDKDIRTYIKEIGVKPLIMDLLSLQGKGVEYPLDYCMKSEPEHRWARWAQIALMVRRKELDGLIINRIGMDKLLERFRE